MKPRTLRLAVLGGVALFLCAALAYVAHLVRALDTPEFKRWLLERASAAIGARVQARAVEASLLEGLTLQGVTIANPPPLAGSLLTADAFVLRYRLWPLVHGRLELTRVAAEKPLLDLAMDARGVFNYERLGASRTAPAAPTAAPAVELVVSKLSVKGGRVVVRDPRSTLVKMDGVDLDSAVHLLGTAAEGEGTLRVATITLADRLFVRNAEAPLHAGQRTLKLAPLRAELGGGSVRGDATVHLQDGFRFTSTLAVEGAQLQKLLDEAHASQAISGRLAGAASVEGTGGLATLKGKGQVHVDGCKVARSPLMTVVATVLRVPELAHPDFDECRATFTLGQGRVVTPTLSLKGRGLQMSGHGVAALESGAIDYDLTLALDDALLARLPAAEMRAAFKDRGDGFSTVDFKATGTMAAPHTDLATRVGKAAAGSALKRFLKRKLF